MLIYHVRRVRRFSWKRSDLTIPSTAMASHAKTAFLNFRARIDADYCVLSSEAARRNSRMIINNITNDDNGPSSVSLNLYYDGWSLLQRNDDCMKNIWSKGTPKGRKVCFSYANCPIAGEFIARSKNYNSTYNRWLKPETRFSVLRY